MKFQGVKNEEEIYKTWKPMIEAMDDIKDDVIKRSTAIVLENTQSLVDEQANIRNSRGILTEAVAGVTTAGAMGPYGTDGSYAGTATVGGNGDARVPSIVIPLIRRIYPNLIAHKLVGVQPMQGPIGMAFAFRAKYGRFGDPRANGKELGYLNVFPSHTGQPQNEKKFAYADSPSGLNGGLSGDNGSLEGLPSGRPFGDTSV